MAKIIDIFILLISKLLGLLNDKKFFEQKFTHIINHNFKSLPFEGKRIFRTIPMECWLLKTENNFLIASGEHILFDENFEQIYLKDCKPGITNLKTMDGKEKVIEVKNLNFKIHMYDVEIDHPSHLYYTNNLASHNTTCACAYILWKAIFNEDQTILIAANKLSSALEIMSRIRYIYEELPEFLKPGVTVYNKSSIEFDNRSRIISRATTPDAGRGLSVSLLYCLHEDTVITVRNKKTKKIENISMRNFFNNLY